MKNSKHRLTMLTASIGVVVLALAGCSSSSEADPPGTADPSTQSTERQQPPDDGNSITGEIAAISGSTLQVQDSSKQSSVTYGDAVVISQKISGTTADVVAGVCVTAMAAVGETTTTDDAAPEVFAATQVSVTQPAADGTCATGMPDGFGGGAPNGSAPNGSAPNGSAPDGSAPNGSAPNGMPSDMPSDMASRSPDDAGGAPADRPTGDGAGMSSASGSVTAVEAETVTVASTDADGTATTSSFTVSETTAVTTTVAADAAALVVGQCVAAKGTADSSGALAAETLTVSAPTEAGCVSRGSRGGGRPTSGASSSSDTDS